MYIRVLIGDCLTLQQRKGLYRSENTKTAVCLFNYRLKIYFNYLVKFLKQKAPGFLFKQTDL